MLTFSPLQVTATYVSPHQVNLIAPAYDASLPDLDVYTPGRQAELKISNRGNNSFSTPTCYDAATGVTTTGSTLLKDEDAKIYVEGYFTGDAPHTYEVEYQADATFRARKWAAGGHPPASSSGAASASYILADQPISTSPTHIDDSVYVSWATTANKTAGSYCRFDANTFYSTPFSPVTFEDASTPTTGADAVMVVEGVYRGPSSYTFQVQMAGTTSLFYYRSKEYPFGAAWSEWSDTLTISANRTAIGTYPDPDRHEDLPSGITVRFPTGLTGKQDGDAWTFVAHAGHLVTYYAEPFVTAPVASPTNAHGDAGSIAVTKDAYDGHELATFTIVFGAGLGCGDNCASFQWKVDTPSGPEGGSPYSDAIPVAEEASTKVKLAMGVSVAFSSPSGWVEDNAYTFTAMPMPSSVLPVLPDPSLAADGTRRLWVSGTYAVAEAAPEEDAVYTVLTTAADAFKWKKGYGQWTAVAAGASAGAHPLADGLVLNCAAGSFAVGRRYTIDARTHVPTVRSVTTPHAGNRASSSIGPPAAAASNRLRANGAENGGSGLLGNVVPDGSHSGKMNISAVPTEGYVTNAYPTIYLKIAGEAEVTNVRNTKALGEADPAIAVTGDYAGDSSFVYVLETGGDDTFRWRKYPKGSTSEHATAWASGVAMDTSTPQGVEDGLAVTFSSLGMAAGVVFEFTAERGHSFVYRRIGQLDWSDPVVISGEPQALGGGVSVLFADRSGYHTGDVFLIQNRTIDSFGEYTGAADATIDVEIVDQASVEPPIFYPGASSTAAGLATVLGVGASAAYTGNTTQVYEVYIASTSGAVSTYKWRAYLEGHAAGPWSPEIDCALFEQHLSFGVAVDFGASDGHSVGDSWRIVAHRGDAFRWRADGGAWSDTTRISSVGMVEEEATNSASGVANADIMAYGSFSGEVDTHFTVEITGANEFRWKRGPRDRVHGTTPGCPTTSTSAECWSAPVTYSTESMILLADDVYVWFESVLSDGDVYHVAAKASAHHELADGVHVAFGSRSGYAGPWSEGAGADAGDTWSFDVSHATPARGPLSGNTELTVAGSGFLPGDGLKCKLTDERTGYEMVVPAQYDSPERVRCVTAAHPPDVLSDAEFFGLGQSDMTIGGVYTGEVDDGYSGLRAATFEVEVVDSTTFRWRANADRATSGDLAYATATFSTDWIALSDGVRVKFGATSGYTALDRWEFYAAHITDAVHPTVELGTIRPGVTKSVHVSNDNGVTWSAAGTALAKFLFSDIYVSPDGSDASGDGTASLPYATLQKAVYAANGEARAGFLYDSATTGEQYRGTPGVGLQAHINRDVVVAYDGHYFGAGNVGLFPLGKVVQVRAATENGALIDCSGSRTGAVLASADHMQPGGATARLGHIGLAGFVVDGCDEHMVGTQFGTAAFGRQWG